MWFYKKINMNRFLYFILTIFLISLKVQAMSVLNVSSTPNLPLDPAKIQTMSDYDLTLCLYRTWFDYDSARQAVPGLVSKWKFDDKLGAYHFTISDKSKWSDGSPLTSEQLIKNLERVIKKKTSYGAAVDAIMNFKEVKIIDEKNFLFPTKNKLPSVAFFQRMGASFLSVTHPKDWDDLGNIVSNKFTIGPYQIKEHKKNRLILVAQPYDSGPYTKRVPQIHMKLNVKPSLVHDFITGKTSEDIMFTTTMMNLDTYEKITSLKWPYWTRTFDRVSFLAPVKTFSKNPEKLRNFIKVFGYNLHNKAETLNLSKVIKVALSLQPKGYPLNDNIKYEVSGINLKTDLPSEVSIVANEGPQTTFQMEKIESLVKSTMPSVRINWVLKPSLAAFYEETNLNDKSNYDLKLTNLGVADPEAATWLSLVLNRQAPCVEISNSDLQQFEKIMKKHQGVDKEVLDLRNLLTSIAERGSYLPLFHYSSMSIAKPGISYANINELDETIDYSKLIIK